MKVTVMGCGASAGVPLIGCDCSVCRSENPKNKRLRASILIESETTSILVDTSPDLRQQALRYQLKTVDAILYTHAHADHVHGVDDIRPFNYHRQSAIPAYANQVTLGELRQRFDYAFLPPKPEYGWFRPCLDGRVMQMNEPIVIGDIEVIPFQQNHGSVDSVGFRVGSFVYSTDVKSFPVEAEPWLQNVDCWILDCLTDERPMPTHADLALSLDWIEQYRPKRAILTHMSHVLGYDDVNRRTPPNVEAAFDGMVIDVS